MSTIGFIGGLGPVELGVLLLFVLVAVLVGVWMSRHARDAEDRVEWHWVIGIVLLFIMGILPGLVGLWLYFSTRERREHAGADTPASGSTLEEWQTGAFIIIATVFGGLVGVAVFTELALHGAIGFVLGAVLVFLAIAYGLYGR